MLPTTLPQHRSDSCSVREEPGRKALDLGSTSVLVALSSHCARVSPGTLVLAELLLLLLRIVASQQLSAYERKLLAVHAIHAGLAMSNGRTANCPRR